LILTGLRLNEVADASWREIDLIKRQWLIPAERMKGKDGKVKPHLVPITTEMLRILEALPRFEGGDFVFSTTFGRSPVWVSDKIKKNLDARMFAELRALAEQRGDDPGKVPLTHWVNHDIRRTVRSGLSRLKIAEEVREAVLAHARPGIKGTYDLYDYREEKLHALEAWTGLLRSIVEPNSPVGNVVTLSHARP
jgi:integrase